MFSLENKSNELQVATEKYKLSQAALEKQMLQQEREHLHRTAQLEKEKQVCVRVCECMCVGRHL